MGGILHCFCITLDNCASQYSASPFKTTRGREHKAKPPDDSNYDSEDQAYDLLATDLDLCLGQKQQLKPVNDCREYSEKERNVLIACKLRKMLT